jgi:signal transduction histidine kinase
VDHYESFCRLLRDTRRVIGGDDTCVQCDRREARISLDSFLNATNGGAERLLSRSFECHMGLQDLTHLICINDVPIALIFSGQYCPRKGFAEIEERVRKLGKGEHAHIQLDEATRAELLDCVRRLPPVPNDAQTRLAAEARYIQDFAVDRFRREKQRREEEFLNRLRRAAAIGTGSVDRDGLKERLVPLLKQIREYCGCQWAICFGSIQEGDTLLAPLGCEGIPAEIAASLPHFNWKKAGLPSDLSAASDLDLVKWLSETGNKGIRGGNSTYFTRDRCLFIPIVQDPRYLSVLALGPLAEPVDLARGYRFLIDMAGIVCISAVTVLEVNYLQRERERWKTTAELLTHQLRTALTPINTRVGSAKALLKYNASPGDVDEARRLLSLTESMVIELARSSRETLEGHITLIEPSDLHLEYYPLSVLVANVASGHISKAQAKNCTIQVDPSVELLPQARVDVGRLSIAIGNLFENAVKYCFSGTSISVRAHLDITDVLTQTSLMTVKIRVQNVGHPVLESEQERVFEQGARGRAFATGQISGAGLGLWEARLVARAHGGDVYLSSCEPVASWRGREKAYRVVFEFRLPLKKEAK